MPPQMPRNELVQLVDRIVRSDGTEQQIDEWIQTFAANVPHPEVCNLIFYVDPPLTAEQIVDKALAYQPIRL